MVIFNSYISLKVDGKQVERYKSHSHVRWDRSLMGKNVSVMSGNEHDQHAETPQRKFAGTVNFIPDVKIKNLKYTNLLKNPVFTGSRYIPHVWSEKKN